jgi:hypothetical protein
VHNLGVDILVRKDPPHLLVLVLELDESSSVHEDLEKDLLAKSTLSTLVTLQVIILAFTNDIEELLVANMAKVTSTPAADDVMVRGLIVSNLDIKLVWEIVLERDILVAEKLLSKEKRRYSC